MLAPTAQRCIFRQGFRHWSLPISTQRYSYTHRTMTCFHNHHQLPVATLPQSSCSHSEWIENVSQNIVDTLRSLVDVYSQQSHGIDDPSILNSDRPKACVLTLSVYHARWISELASSALQEMKETGKVFHSRLINMQNGMKWNGIVCTDYWNHNCKSTLLTPSELAHIRRYTSHFLATSFQQAKIRRNPWNVTAVKQYSKHGKPVCCYDPTGRLNVGHAAIGHVAMTKNQMLLNRDQKEIAIQPQLSNTEGVPWRCTIQLGDRLMVNKINESSILRSLFVTTFPNSYTNMIVHDEWIDLRDRQHYMDATYIHLYGERDEPLPICFPPTLSLRGHRECLG